MKLIRAIIRPEREAATITAMEAVGIVALTKMDVLGRGRQGGIRVGSAIYEEIPKVQLLIVLEDTKVDSAIAAIQTGARTGQFGDGLLFVTPVETAWTIRTGQRMEGPAAPKETP